MSDEFAGLTLSTGYQVGAGIPFGPNAQFGAGGYVTAFGGPANNGLGVYWSAATSAPVRGQPTGSSWGIGGQIGWQYALTVGNAEDLAGTSVTYTLFWTPLESPIGDQETPRL